MEIQIDYKEPSVTSLNNGNLRLNKRWVVYYGNWKIVVPKKFVSDGNSVPPIFQWLVPRYGLNTNAGILHDWLYRYGKVTRLNPDGTETDVKITQRQADIIRLDVCRWCSVPRRQRGASYLGLRLGGFSTWNGYRRKESCNSKPDVPAKC